MCQCESCLLPTPCSCRPALLAASCVPLTNLSSALAVIYSSPVSCFAFRPALPPARLPPCKWHAPRHRATLPPCHLPPSLNRKSFRDKLFHIFTFLIFFPASVDWRYLCHLTTDWGNRNLNQDFGGFSFASKDIDNQAGSYHHDF